MKQSQDSRASGLSGSLETLSNFLISRGFVIALLCLLLVVCFLAVLVPQQPSMAYRQWQAEHLLWATVISWAKLDHIFTSPIFLALVFLTALSATLSLILRFRQLGFLRLEGSLWERLATRRKLLGSLIFHAGLVGIIIAAAISGISRSSGNVVITEGQVLAIDRNNLANSQPPRTRNLMGHSFELRLDKFHPLHEGRWGTPDYASELSVIENGRIVKQATVSVNQPLSHRGVTAYQSRHGFSPQISLTDGSGQLRFGSWVALQSDLESDPVRYFDEFIIPGTSLFVRAEFFPDAYMEGDRLRNRSADPGNAILEVAVNRDADPVYKGMIPMGQSVELEPGLHLGFLGVRYWTGLELVHDRGAGALFFFAWAAIMGICLRFAPNLSNLAKRLWQTGRVVA